MLRLEKIQISGFKSFSDYTEAVFPDGITAVVGPNGCGKSNIGDAINWVLGEQSAKMMRGASMQDVIFNGSEARKALGLAEVSLHLNGPGGENGDPRRITVTRRLFRSGESEYLLNGARSRLRDIQDLLREERVGAQTYATIEQGRIEQILNAKPKDRRLIIEEAAGIAGFKHKRRLAELKLEATQANLLRVTDIVAEVARQINSLKRQAAKARRYARLRDELRRKEALRFARKACALDAELVRLRAAESEAKASEAQAAADLSRLESALVEERLALEEADRGARAAADALHQLDMEIDRKNARLRAAEERIAGCRETESRLAREIEGLGVRRSELAVESQTYAASLHEGDEDLQRARTRLDELQHAAAAAESDAKARREHVDELRGTLFAATNRLAEARNRRRSVEEALERSRSHGTRLVAERQAAALELETTGNAATNLGLEAQEHLRSVEELEEVARRAEEALRNARARLSEDGESLAAARAAEKSVSARLLTLEDVATRFAGVSDGVRMLLSGGAQGVSTLGVVADFVEAAPEFEEAAEAYLQTLLPAVVVRDDDDARRACDLLRSSNAGRTMLLSASHPTGAPAIGVPSNGHAPLPEELRRDPRVIGRLKDRIALKAGDGFVRDRIGDAVLVDSLESALALHARHPHTDYLTPTGEVVYVSGLLAAGGRHQGESGLLAHNRRIHDERAHLVEAAAAAETAAARVSGGKAEEARLDEEMRIVRVELETATRRRLELDLQKKRTEDDHVRAMNRVGVLAQEIATLEADEGRLGNDLAAANSEVAAAESAFAEIEATLAREAAALDGLQAEVRRLGEEAAAQRAGVAGRRQSLETTRREVERVARTIAELDQRGSTASGEAEASRARREEEAAIEQEVAAELGQVVAKRQGDAETLARLEADNTARRAALQEQEGGLKEARAGLDVWREAARDAELHRIRAESDRSHLDDLCVQDLGASALDAAQAGGPETEEELALDAARLEADVTDLKGKIEAIGPVNLMAIEEFRDLEQRHDFLTAQKKDLEDSIESLRESIRRINRNSRERFLEVFAQVRTSFQEIFKVLFNGGRADLVLEEGEDVLECGIEMIAQPPGKKLGHVSLMSGGEKSMTAIALLFAIFRIQPSPFCLLDEVDAALDDLNVHRFTRMLREYAETTQFILITHNKRSMESANLLYGVTMEEPGVSRLVSIRL